MNLYILVEGRHTERKIYPKWLEHLLPPLTKVQIPSAAQENNYYLVSGGGYPRLLDVTLPDAVQDIVDVGVYHYLVVILDADNMSVRECEAEVQAKVDEAGIELGACRLKIIVQNRCIETWALGNRGLFSHHPDRTLRAYIDFFNVFENDPELMVKPSHHQRSIADFHFAYLKTMLVAKNINYSKNKPHDVAEPYYLDHLRQRVVESPTHLTSFQTFLDFCSLLQEKIII